MLNKPARSGTTSGSRNSRHYWSARHGRSSTPMEIRRSSPAPSRSPRRTLPAQKRPHPDHPKERHQTASSHRSGHVSYEASQVRAGIRAPAVGKVDEIHNLSLATRTGAEVSDTLKYFSDGSRPPSATPGSAWTAPAYSPAPAANRSPAGSAWSAPAHSARSPMDRADRRPRRQPATPPPPAGHTHEDRPLPAPAHPQHDRQLALADPQRRDQRRPRRHREDHQAVPGSRRGRHHRPVPRPPAA
jgi:hypothetical protein